MAGFLKRVHGGAGRLRADSRSGWDEKWWTPTIGYMSEAGMRVTPDTAMTLSAYWAGVSFLARNIGSFPCQMYERTGANRDEKQRATGMPLAYLLRWQPNETMTALEYWEMKTAHLVRRGNTYSRIVPGRRGFADQLRPIHPDRVRPERLPSGRKVYRIDGGEETLVQEEVFHVMGLSSDGVSGLSPLEYGAMVVGKALAAESFAARFFKQGAAPAFIIKHPGELGPEGRANVSQTVSELMVGLQNAHGVPVLDEGMEPMKIGLNFEELQLLSTLENGVRDVARILGLPLHVLGVNDKAASFASIEMFNNELVTFAFRPLVTRIAQAIQRDLILAKDRFFAEFLLDDLKRADSKARAEYFRMAIAFGWMTRNEVRALENMNSLPGLDKPLEPNNMTGVGDARRGLGSDSDQQDGSSEDSKALILPTSRKAQAADLGVRATLIVYEAAARLVRKEVAAATRAARNHANDGAAWASWIKEFYGEHAKQVANDLKLPLTAAREYAARQGLRLEREGVAALEDFEATVPAELTRWALTADEKTAA